MFGAMHARGGVFQKSFQMRHHNQSLQTSIEKGGSQFLALNAIEQSVGSITHRIKLFNTGAEAAAEVF